MVVRIRMGHRILTTIPLKFFVLVSKLIILIYKTIKQAHKRSNEW